MKSKSATLFVGILMSAAILAKGQVTSDILPPVMSVVKQIILDDSPLTDEEFFYAYHSADTKPFFNQRFTAAELNSDLTFFFSFPVELEDHPLMPRFIKYLVKDAHVVKASSYENVMAIHVAEEFDLETFEYNLLRLNLSFIRTNKESFDKVSK